MILPKMALTCRSRRCWPRRRCWSWKGALEDLQAILAELGEEVEELV